MLRPLFPMLLLVVAAANGDAVDDYVKSEMARQQIPGLSLLIVRDGELTKVKGYGLANVEHNVPASADTIYQSGSVGKQFTAAAILLLVDEGKLQLDDPLAKHFPEAPSAWHRITIRQLLAHTSGLKEYTEQEVDYREEYTEDELLQRMMALPVEFEPGTQWSYSNSGYLILGIVVSKLTGAHWSEFVSKRIFQELGMDTARLISDTDIVPNRAAGYVRDEQGELFNQDWVSRTMLSTGDGALYFTVKDLAVWDAALRDRKLLGADSYSTWWTPIEVENGCTYPYGFGWWISEQRGRRVIEHSGSWQGFKTFIARYVDDGITIAALANVDTAEPRVIVHEVVGMLNADLRLPPAKTTGKDPDKAQTATARSVLEAWASWKTVSAMGKCLAETATGSAGETSSRNDLGQKLAKAKRFHWLADDDLKTQPLQRRGETVTRIAYYVLETEDKKYRYRFYLTADGRVADFVEDRGSPFTPFEKGGGSRSDPGDLL